MRRLGVLTALVAMTCLPQVAMGQLTLNENIDGYTVGLITGQGPWRTWGNAGGGIDGEVSAAQNHTPGGSKSVFIPDVNSDCVVDVTNPGGGSGVYELKAYIYPPSGTDGNQWFIGLDVPDTGATHWVFQVVFNLSTGVATKQDAAGGSLPFMYDTWNELIFKINLVASPPNGTLHVFLNGCPFTPSPHAYCGNVSAAPCPTGPTLTTIDLYCDAGGSPGVYWDDITLTDVGAAPTPVSISTAGARVGLKGTAYSGHPLAASGGTPPYTFSLQSGSLPAGLTLNADGTITGTVLGDDSSFVAKVMDSLGGMATRLMRIDVLDCQDELVGLENRLNAASVCVAGGTPALPLSKIIRFSPSTNSILGEVTMDRYAFGLARDPATGFYYTLSDEVPYTPCDAGSIPATTTQPNLYRVNPVTGVTTLVGTVNFTLTRGFVGAMAINPVNSKLYLCLCQASTPSVDWQFMEVNKATAQVETGYPVQFGTFGTDFCDSMAFKSNGTLYAVSGRARLVTVNPTTGGVSTTIVPTNGGGGPSAMAFMGGELFYVNGGDDEQNSLNRRTQVKVVSLDPIIDPVCLSQQPASVFSSNLPGDPRVYGTVNPAEISGCQCKGDMNSDGEVDVDDTGMFVTALLADNAACADLNADCSANGKDIQIFVLDALSNGGLGKPCGKGTRVRRCGAPGFPDCPATPPQEWCLYNTLDFCGGIESSFSVACSAGSGVCAGAAGADKRFLWVDAPGGPCEILGDQFSAGNGVCDGGDGGNNYKFVVVP